MSGDGAKEFQMPKFTLDDQIDWLERNGNDPLDVLASLRELKRIMERKDLQRNVGCARGQNTTQFCAEAVAAQSRLAKVMEVIESIQQWCDAYPIDIFPEPDFAKARELLAAGGITIDAISASNMRHVVNGVAALLRTIEGSGGEDKMEEKNG